MKILIAYDGTVHAKKALRYALARVKDEPGDVKVLQVFDRGQFVDYDAGPRAEELARAEAGRQLDEAKAIIAGSATADRAAVVADEGDALDRISARVEADDPCLVIVPPRYKQLAASLSRPVMVVPGTLLVPVDASADPAVNSADIAREAAALGSGVLLLGIVPVHLYSREEKKELERVKKGTAAAVKQLKKLLAEQGIEGSELIRSGYPDEEILKAAGEHAVSLVLLPSGSTTPSELSKAAAILLDEPERLKWPVLLLPPSAA